ncbi:MAG TPA: biotin--[acetyl-CoA-carboxylase] ligase [Gaiellaceae bacterium]|nr:biotin--[acetyl-CoA-carboxylase] ligase [Gaiellaceae bacterium]
MASLAPEFVEPLLRGRLGRPYVYVECCHSTQRLLDADAPEGAVVVTDEQTAGRGRLGRAWHAPRGSSILMSIVLRPHVPSPELPELSVVAGAAVAHALTEAAAVAPTIKLPNDVLIDGKKVAGVLAEASDGRVVLGIGVNVSQRADELPRDVAATSLRIATGREHERAPLLARILLELEHRYDAWVSGFEADG